MSKNKDYTRMLNSKRWKELRALKLMRNPLCQMCEREGIVTAAVDVHHIRPVESARTLADMEALCFNPNNLLALCVGCHIKIHQDRKSHTKAAHQQRERERLDRWIDKHNQLLTSNNKNNGSIKCKDDSQ